MFVFLILKKKNKWHFCESWDLNPCIFKEAINASVFTYFPYFTQQAEKSLFLAPALCACVLEKEKYGARG
jgi:hypothetical protein